MYQKEGLTLKDEFNTHGHNDIWILATASIGGI